MALPIVKNTNTETYTEYDPLKTKPVQMIKLVATADILIEVRKEHVLGPVEDQNPDDYPGIWDELQREADEACKLEFHDLAIDYVKKEA